MVSLVVAPPVVKSLDVTDVVQVPSKAPRASLTDTVPSCADVVAEPVAAEPRLLDAGVVIDNAPPVRVNVAVVLPLVAALAGTAWATMPAAAAADTTSA